MKSQLLVFILTCLFALPAMTQSLSRSSITAAGDYTTSEKYTLSWSIGELSAYSTIQRSHHLTGGFQQGELRTSADTRSANTSGAADSSEELPLHRKSVPQQVEVSVYPNPTMQALSLNLSGFSAEVSQVLIFDAQAKIVIRQSFDLSQEQHLQIDQVATLPPGNYFLQVHQNGSLQWSSTFVKI